jgi:hypothetical protein
LLDWSERLHDKTFGPIKIQEQKTKKKQKKEEEEREKARKKARGSFDVRIIRRKVAAVEERRWK